MYDIIIIGAGSGGLNIAVFMTRVGLKVLLIDKTDKNIGGDCLNTGCVPSKALIHVARTIASTKESEKYNISISGEVSLEKVMEHVHKSIETIRTHENREHFIKMGIDVVLGNASFSGTNEVSVDGVSYRGKKIVIATGSRPRELSIPGVEESHVVTNESVFELKTLPKNLVVIGTGPIGIELGQAFLMLGSSVTFVGNDKSILPREKHEYAEVLFKTLQSQGATFAFESDTLRIENGKTLIIQNKVNKEEKTIPFDTILVAIGRRLNVEGLNLEKAGIESKDGKIVVNEYLETTNKNVLVCGDVAGGYQFTHAAEVHAKVLLNNFFNPFKKKTLTYDDFSWVTYTTPEIATFGASEDSLKKKGIVYQVLETSFSEDDRAIADMSTEGKSEIYIDTKTKHILGGTMVARNAGELVQELLLTMSARLPIDVLFNKVYPYPTATRINKKLISEYFKNKLTDFNTKILRFLYRYI